MATHSGAPSHAAPAAAVTDRRDANSATPSHADDPISRGPHPVRRLAAQIRAASAADSCRGEGRDERSTKHAPDERSSWLAAR